MRGALVLSLCLYSSLAIGEDAASELIAVPRVVTDSQGVKWRYQIVTSDAIGVYSQLAGLPSSAAGSLQRGSEALKWQPYRLKAMLGRGSQVALESWTIKFKPLRIEWTAILAMRVGQYQEWPDQFPLCGDGGNISLSRQWEAPTGGIANEELRWCDTVHGASQICWSLSCPEHEIMEALPNVKMLKLQLPWMFAQMPPCIRNNSELLDCKVSGVGVIADGFAKKNGDPHVFVLHGFQCDSVEEAFPDFRVSKVTLSSRAGWSLVQPSNGSQIVELSVQRSSIRQLRFAIDASYEPKKQLTEMDRDEYLSIIKELRLR